MFPFRPTHGLTMVAAGKTVPEGVREKQREISSFGHCRPATNSSNWYVLGPPWSSATLMSASGYFEEENSSTSKEPFTFIYRCLAIRCCSPFSYGLGMSLSNSCLTRPRPPSSAHLQPLFSASCKSLFNIFQTYAGVWRWTQNSWCAYS